MSERIGYLWVVALCAPSWKFPQEIDTCGALSQPPVFKELSFFMLESFQVKMKWIWRPHIFMRIWHTLHREAIFGIIFLCLSLKVKVCEMDKVSSFFAQFHFLKVDIMTKLFFSLEIGAFIGLEIACSEGHQNDFRNSYKESMSIIASPVHRNSHERRHKVESCCRQKRREEKTLANILLSTKVG